MTEEARRFIYEANTDTRNARPYPPVSNPDRTKTK